MSKIMKIMIKLFCLVLMLNIIYLHAQEIKTKLRFSNSIYVYEGNQYTDNSFTETEKIQHTRLYQKLFFQAKYSKYRFNTALRMLNDLGDDDLRDERKYNLYRLSLSGKNLFGNFLDFELGRQFLHPGLVFGSLDGLNLKLKPFTGFNFQLYGGIESHLINAIKLYEADDALVFGGRLIYKNWLNSNIEALYFQKNSNNETQWQIGGINIANKNLINNLHLNLQAHYDILNERFHRLYLSLTYFYSDKLQFSGYAKQQYPQIYGDSYFRIFEINKYMLSGLSINYNVFGNYFIAVNGQNVIFEEGYGNRYLLTFSNPDGSFTITYETGDLGDQIGAIIEYGYEILPDLTASICVDYSQYRFEEIYDYESQLANAMKLAYNLSKHWLIDAEYQWLNNRINKADHRFLNRIHFKW